MEKLKKQGARWGDCPTYNCRYIQLDANSAFCKRLFDITECILPLNRTRNMMCIVVLRGHAFWYVIHIKTKYGGFSFVWHVMRCFKGTHGRGAMQLLT